MLKYKKRDGITLQTSQLLPILEGAGGVVWLVLSNLSFVRTIYFSIEFAS